MKTISIIAATLSGNRGAEAMLTTTIGRIRDHYPDANFNIYSYYPERDSELVNDPKITIYSATPLYLVSVLLPCSFFLTLLKLTFLKSFRTIMPKSILGFDDSDVLIDLAGVSFIDGREKFLPYNVLTLMPALLLNTPVIKFSQALGPFRNPLNRFLAKKTLSRLHMTFARGKQTQQYLKSFLPDSCYAEPIADLAFLHQSSDVITIENPGKADNLAKRLKGETRDLIGICPSSLLAVKLHKHQTGYQQQIASLCRRLIEQGYAVLIYPNATRESSMSSLRNNDLPVISDIVKQLKNDSAVADYLYFIDFDINTKDIKRLMSYCRLVMVSRFHAMIAALASSQPVIVLGWSHKYQEVMDYFGLGDLVFDFNQFDSDSLLEAIKHTLDNELIIQQKIEQHQESVKASAYTQFSYLFKLLD